MNNTTAEYDQMAMEEQQMQSGAPMERDPLLEQIDALFPSREKVIEAVERSFRAGEMNQSYDSIVDRLPDDAQKWQTLTPIELVKNPRGNRVMIFEPRIQKSVLTVNIRYSGSEDLMVFLENSKPQDFSIVRINSNSVEVAFPSIHEIDYRNANSLENIKKIMLSSLESFESRIFSMNAKILKRSYELNDDIEIAVKTRQAEINRQKQFEDYLND
ncbi:MAG: hypothetical protein LBI74_04775 [Synergistaceae bacterium]|jgi:hypothetical protein|nr:hypothetical protein [Synergistaceae bacterium]